MGENQSVLETRVVKRVAAVPYKPLRSQSLPVNPTAEEVDSFRDSIAKLKKLANERLLVCSNTFETEARKIDALMRKQPIDIHEYQTRTKEGGLTTKGIAIVVRNLRFPKVKVGNGKSGVVIYYMCADSPAAFRAFLRELVAHYHDRGQLQVFATNVDAYSDVYPFTKQEFTASERQALGIPVPEHGALLSLSLPQA